MADEFAFTVSNTGPLISAFQSDSFDLISELLGIVHTTESCRAELVRHGWQAYLDQIGAPIRFHSLTTVEAERALELAQHIANHPASKNREPASHRGEAEAIALAQRPEFSGSALLLDELAARAVAVEAGLTISGFAGVLLIAVEHGLLAADDLKGRLEACRQQGTHYSTTLIERVYQAAQEYET